MWDAIAYWEMGSVLYTDLRKNANIRYCHYFHFPAGIRLAIPEVPEDVSESLPPWKK